MKKFICGFIVGTLVLFSFNVLATVLKNNEFPIVVNGEKQDVKAYNIDEKTYLGLRELGNLLNVNIEFRDNTIFIGEEKIINVAFEIKDYGKIVMELYPNHAPITVNNFVQLINSDFYNGLTLHRIIEDFVIQGGDPLGNGMGGAEKQIKGEFFFNDVMNPLKHTRGTVSMARANNPDSASSQFFIVQKDASHLDGQYAAFGKVILGMDVVDKIATVEVDSNSFPLVPITIEQAYVVTDN